MKRRSMYTFLSLFVCMMVVVSATQAAGPWGGGGWGGGTANQPPVIDAQSFSAEENSPVGTAVGTVVASDPDGNALSYAITADDSGGAFTIASSTGALTVANPAALDFETTPSVSLTVQVTDTAGSSANTLVTVYLTDVVEEPIADATELLLPPEGDASFVSAHFSGSGNCAACHNGLRDESNVDVSLEADWSTSMMANATTDPFWRAKVASELKRNPHLKDEIGETCSRCHAPMANVEANLDGAPVEILGGGFLNPLNAYHEQAMDGVSCTLCHQIADDGKLGTMDSFSGGFSIESVDGSGGLWAYGQYLSPRVNPMLNDTGFRPMYGDHTGSSELCGTCHNLKTPFVDGQGNVVPTSPELEFPEQMVYSEWENSSFGSGASKTSCLACHMKTTNGVKIANRPRNLPRRDDFARHTMTGANTTMLTILADNSAELGVTASGFDAAIARTEAFLSTESAELDVLSAGVDENGNLVVTLQVTNKTGHKLPTSYPSRRAYIHFTVQDQDGIVVFESGKTNPNGSIVGVDSDEDLNVYEPHYQEIISEDQVQVYEPMMGDVDGAVTYTLLRAATYLKDNRLTPAGFDKDQVGDNIAVRGDAFDDPDFNSGSDTVTYQVSVPAGVTSLAVTANLRYQALGYAHLQDLFLDAVDEPEVARFQRLWENATRRTETLASAATVVLP